jgi:iron complex transport system permease protein
MRRQTLVSSIGLSLLAAAMLLSIGFGAGRYGVADVLGYLVSNGGTAASQELHELLWGSRLSRTAAALMVGGGLGLSGALLQSVTRNPLAEPGLLGVNAGGVLGIAVGVTYFAASSLESYMVWSGGGALAATLLVLGISQLSRRSSPPQLILIGIASSATLGGLANFVLMAHEATLEQFRFWNLGSLAGVELGAVERLLPYFAAACLVVALLVRWLSVMQLGDDQAKTMGVPVESVRLAVWVTTAVLTACALSLAGPVMFAGFLAAYLARHAAGPRLAWQLFHSWIFGMSLLLIADLVGRLAVRPYEVPVGVVVALVGTPLTIVAARSRGFRAALVQA